MTPTGTGTDKIREAMDAIRARDIAAIRASTVTGGAACARCGRNTVHGHTVMGAWYCRDTETCEGRKLDLGTHADLPDPAHHGDVFSRIDASQEG